MHPPIFQVCAASAAVTALLDSPPSMRLYEFGEAPQRVALPYAVWQGISGAPENYMDCPPDIDSIRIQVDVYAARGRDAIDVAKALRDAIQGHAHIVRWGGQNTDPETKNPHISFDVEWYIPR